MNDRYKISASNNIHYNDGLYGLDEHMTAQYWSQIKEWTYGTYGSEQEAKRALREAKMNCQLKGFPPIPTEDSICELELQEINERGELVGIIGRRKSWYTTESSDKPIEVDFG